MFNQKEQLAEKKDTEIRLRHPKPLRRFFLPMPPGRHRRFQPVLETIEEEERAKPGVFINVRSGKLA